MTAEVDTVFRYWLPNELGGQGTEFYPGTANSMKAHCDDVPMKVYDVRGREGRYGLDRNGFEYHKHTSKEKLFDDEARVKKDVYDETIELLKKR